MNKLRRLKDKIVSTLTKELKSETNNHISQLENERNIILEKTGKRNINPFNYFKINYCNFKDGYINKSGLFFSNLRDIFPILGVCFSIVVTNVLYNLSVSAGLHIGFFQILSYFLSILTLTQFPTLIIFLKNGFKRKAKSENKIDKINNKIDKLNKEMLKLNFEHLFEKGKTFEKIHDRTISVEILREIEKSLNKEEIVRIMQKSNDEHIKYQDLIELIIELDNNENAIKNYNKIFPFFSNLNKEEKIKEKELAFK